jgi:cellulose biosynthesis protein BcsQ
MPIILIANPKGGVGKSTTATNLAGYFARRGHATMLGDLDRQQSALAWLRIRPAALPRIDSWDRTDDKVARPPKGVTHVVLDSPAGIHGHGLKDALKLADRVIIPLQPSLFDIYATQAFLGKLAERDVLKGDGRVGVLGMRVDAARARRSSCSVSSTTSDCQRSASCAIRRTTCSWPRTASRYGMWRRAASPATSNSGRRCSTGSKARSCSSNCRNSP